MRMIGTVKEICQIFVLAVLTGLGANALSPHGIALVGQWDVNKGVVTAVAKNDVVSHDREITGVDEAYALYQTGSALFVDARDKTMYDEGHIKGAVDLSVYDYDLLFGEFIQAHPRMDQLIVTYCSGRECEDSHRLAQYLSEDGYTHVRVFIDGYPSWQAKGLPVESTD